MRRFMFLAALAFPVLAFAQDTAPAAPSIWTQLWGFVTSPAGLGLIGTLVTAVAGMFGLSVVRKRQLALLAYHAFHIVNDIDNELGTDKLDKVVAGLKTANEWALAQGWRPLKPGEEQLVKLHFQALHGAEKQAVKVATEAALAAKLGTGPVVGGAATVHPDGSVTVSASP